MDDAADLQLYLTAALGARLKAAVPTGGTLAPITSLAGLTDLAVRRAAEHAARNDIRRPREGRQRGATPAEAAPHA